MWAAGEENMLIVLASARPRMLQHQLTWQDAPPDAVVAGLL